MSYQKSAIRTSLGVGLALFVVASAAYAGQGIYDVRGTCRGNNCQSILLNGSYDVDDRSDADCFSVQLYTAGSECVRLQVSHAWDTDPDPNNTTDPAMTFSCPDGSIWRDDDSGAGVKPLIKAETSGAGWCTVQVCDYRGAGYDADFRLRYGRYVSGNPNCNNPTPALGQPFNFSRVAGEQKRAEDPD